MNDKSTQRKAARVTRERAAGILVGRVHKDISSQIAESVSDLDQTQQLLNDAIEQLMKSFNGMQGMIHKQKSEIAWLIDQGNNQADAKSEILTRQDKLSREAENIVAEAITAMQFQDMVGQLLRHSGRRMVSVQTSCEKLGACTETMRKSVSVTELDRMHQEILELIASAAELGRTSPVQQNSMDAGEIDLF